MRSKKHVIIVILAIFLITYLSICFTTANSREPSPWSCTINVSESSGCFDNVVFGEDVNASDGIDSYDVPNPPPSPPPMIDAYFYNASQSPPYGKLMEDWKHYSAENVMKKWTLRILWQNAQNTNITLSWNLTDLRQSEYDCIILNDTHNDYSLNMLETSNYSFEISPLQTRELGIIAQKDVTPPTTIDDYDGLWHTQDFIITLTANDDLSGVAETCYKINDEPIKNVSRDGQPLITTESANNKLEYWSVDNVGNEELPHKNLIGIKLDETPPMGSITINSDVAYTISTLVTLNLTATDTISGVYQIRLSNDGVWDTEPWEPPVTTINWTLPSGDGTKSVDYQIKDNAGLISETYSDLIILDTAPPTIEIPSRIPSGDVRPNQPVKILVNVTDALSEIKNVALFYTIDNGTTWSTLAMDYNTSRGLYEGTIPGQPVGTLVRYKVIAQDNAGNPSTKDGTQPYSIYQVTETIVHEGVINGQSFSVVTASNSTVSDFGFDETQNIIHFRVEGVTDTTGFCNVTIPHDLMQGPYTVKMDGAIILEEYQAPNNGTHSFIYFTYIHTTHQVQIIPEFPQPAITMLIMIVSVITVALAKKKRAL